MSAKSITAIIFKHHKVFFFLNAPLIYSRDKRPLMKTIFSVEMGDPVCETLLRSCNKHKNNEDSILYTHSLLWILVCFQT